MPAQEADSSGYRVPLHLGPRKGAQAGYVFSFHTITHGRAGMGHADRAFRAVGWLLFLQWCCGEGIAFPHHRVGPREHCGSDALDSTYAAEYPHATHEGSLDRLVRHGALEQRGSLHAIRVGAAPYREWLGRHPQRHYATFHSAGRAFSDAG